MDETYWALRADKVIAELSQGKRLDGRKLDQYRDISLQKSYSQNADGSALIRLGKTEVVAGVKIDLAEPYPDTPDEGGLTVGAELFSGAAPEFEAGPPREESIELARVVDRCIRESKTLDFKSLFVSEGKAFFVFLDLYVLNHDGNLFDASSLAAMAALTDAKMPKLEEEKIVRKEYAGKLKVRKKPVLSSFAKINGHTVLDPSLEEDMAAQARFHVGTTEDDLLCAFQKGGSGSFTEKELLEAIETALKESKKLRKLL